MKGKGKGRFRATLKGRTVDPQALAEVRKLLGDAPRRRDLLIEHLHRIQDAYGQLSAAHLAALGAGAAHGARRGLRGGDLLPPLRRGQGRLEARGGDGAGVRLDRLRAGRRAGAARAAARGARQRGAGAARALRRALRGGAGGGGGPEPGHARHGGQGARGGRAPRDRVSGGGVHRLRQVPAHGRLRADRRLPRGQAHARGDHEDHGGLGAARPRRRRLSRRAQVAHRRRRARAAPDGGQHRRGRARHLQGPLVPRARPAPLPRGHAGRRVVRGGGRDLYLSAGRVRGLPQDSRERAREAEGEAALRAAADPPAPRRGGLHLRRGVGDDRVDRGQARHAAPAPALRRPGRRVRPPDARAQPGDGVLGAPDRAAGRGLVRRPRPPRPQGPALVLGLGPGQQARACTSRRPASRCAS